MTKSDIIRKLTSRKLWMAVCGFVTALLAAFGASESTTAQVVGIIMAGATVVGYIVGEGLADAARARGEMTGAPVTGSDDADSTDCTDCTESEHAVVPVPPECMEELNEQVQAMVDAIMPIVWDMQSVVEDMVKAITPAVQQTAKEVQALVDDMLAQLDDQDKTREV